ncbi:hypothetical protein [Luteipulveratus flavus]|uniref:Uncharacterized protein n=1 Tax=Luteipulveratus flavus TaxID=3031728 RepID=A0ABT6C3M6_9MICO|nr:hypothetical protein [Luteipulveratus sp. YIM 133296]MDF8263256.1 hypothetical protein [Luteipulveratus sp. YIM 133296]
MSRPVPGSPDDLLTQTRAIRRQATYLRTHSRAVSTTVAGHVSTWQGTASIGYATRAGQHRRTATAGAAALDGVSAGAERFARDLVRLQREASTHLSSRDRLAAELLPMLAERRHPQLLTPSELSSLTADITHHRRLIQREDAAVERLVGEYKRIKARLYGEIVRLLPSDVRPGFVRSIDYREVMHDAKAVGTGYNGIAYLRSLPPVARSATVGELIRTATTSAARLHALQGGVLVTATRTPGTRRVLATAFGRQVARRAGPIGVALTITDAAHDVRDGGGYDGARGTATRAAGGVAMVGGALVLVPATAPVGGAILVGYSAWTLGNLAYDHRHAIGRTVSGWFGRDRTPPTRPPERRASTSAPRCDPRPARDNLTRFVRGQQGPGRPVPVATHPLVHVQRAGAR